ncbi:chromate transporter [Mycoplasma sp. 'Moose RK']|uniref:chromate transporter n=1 Tax=Mycoplasma sp. 'Moose RK' TaxID=2780095 RepID=UPI0018C1EF03|nr:chromate transporter [Mycoplasma sp. 'Moose RK']MBG0730922.1 chromate transporter [Mycoplasma sp. 'Moose RK']
MNWKLSKFTKINKFLDFLWFIIKISMVSFGGGNALMPIIYEQAVVKKKWITKADFDDGFIMTNLLPGPSVLQMISFIAIKKLGFLSGILVSILGLLPHVLLFSGLLFLTKFLPKNYFIVLNLAALTTIVGILLGFSYIYWKNNSKSLNFGLYFALLFFSFIYCFFVPSPYNLSLVPVFVAILVYSIWFFFKKLRKKSNDRIN